MAIHPKLHTSSAAQGSLTPQQAVEISAWSEHAIESLTLSSSPVPYGDPIPLRIPIDDDSHRVDSQSPLRARNVRVAGRADSAPISTAYRRREPIGRDTVKRRELLMKGKEGSRRRQRWENDRLISNPWAQPPSANDWEIQPTHPRHNTVPYYLAPLWESHYAAKEQARRTSNKKKTPGANGSAALDEDDRALHQIPKELRIKLKHARAARGMLQGLEEEIRCFVQEWLEKQTKTPLPEADDNITPTPDGMEKQSTKGIGEDEDEDEDSEDEVVFTGRKAQTQRPPTPSKGNLDRLHGDIDRAKEKKYGEKMVFESLAEDRTAGFGRWLVHSLASYYGLRTWSVTVGNPPRREAYVGIDHLPPDTKTSASQSKMISTPAAVLPRPLWVSV